MSSPKSFPVKKTLDASLIQDIEKDSIKKSIDIIALFGEFGVSLKKVGNSYLGKCPWHEDSKPSLSVDAEQKIYHCFGCGSKGDAFSLVMTMKGYDFALAKNYLAEFTGMGPINQLRQPLPTESKPLEEPAKPQENLLSLVAKYYQKELETNKKAQEYLKSRHLLDWNILRRLGVGFCQGTLVETLSESQKAQLTELGILTVQEKEAFAGYITIPLKDPKGQVVSFYARSITELSNLKHRYLKGSHQGLVNREAIPIWREETILTESILDAVSLLTLGIENVLPCYGANGFTAEHLGLLKEERVKKVVIAFDADEAGRKAALKLQEKLLGEGFLVSVIEAAVGKDWNEALGLGLTKEVFKGFLENAKEEKPQQKPETSLVKEGEYWMLKRESFCYRIKDLGGGSVASIKVSIKVFTAEASYIDTFDLYQAAKRSSFVAQVCRRFNQFEIQIERDLLVVLDALERIREQEQEGKTASPQELTPEEQHLGLSFLQSPHLFEQLVDDMETLGYVGDNANKLLLYLCASSRKMDNPMSMIFISQSASGKSHLVDTVKKLIPEEDVIAITSLSEQALNYVSDLTHKFLVLGEAIHSEGILYQIREMLSGKELSRLVVVKDEKTGKLESKYLRIPVIISSVMTSTNRKMNQENTSRCFVVEADESPTQSQAILGLQRRKYSMDRREEKKLIPQIVKKHHCAQRLLQKREIINDYAVHLGFPINYI